MVRHTTFLRAPVVNKQRQDDWSRRRAGYFEAGAFGPQQKFAWESRERKAYKEENI